MLNWLLINPFSVFYMDSKPVIGIIGGKGKMGSLFAHLFTQAGYSVLISDRHTKLQNHQLARKSDVVLIAVPIEKTLSVIKKIVRHIKPNSLIMDITSIKNDPVQAMLKSTSAVIGLHPMFNETTYGPGQTVIFCPARPKKWLKWLKNVFQNEFQLNLVQLTPEKHDRIMTVVQGLVHFAEISFAHALKKSGLKPQEYLKFAGPASYLKIEMAARILAQDPNLYGQIQIQNSQNLNVQKEYLDSMANLHEIITQKDAAGFDRYFKEGSRYLGAFKKSAFSESDWLIAQLLEKRQHEKPPAKVSRPAKNSLAILGPPQTYTDIAAEKYLKKSRSSLPKAYFEDIPAIFQAVKNRRVKLGIVPIENRLHGTIRDTLDQLFQTNLQIIKEINLPIHHCLATLPENKTSQIRHIISHPQTFYQCSQYLRKHFPKAKLIPAVSTVEAMETLIRQKHPYMAVIGSPEAARHRKLKILARHIENDRSNQTTFIVFRRQGLKKGQKTSIAFHFDKDKPGSLFTVFKEFADAKINLTKIESRPARKELGEYIFFLDFEGALKSTSVQKVLNRLKRQVAKIKIFGSY